MVNAACTNLLCAHLDTHGRSLSLVCRQRAKHPTGPCSPSKTIRPVLNLAMQVREGACAGSMKNLVSMELEGNQLEGALPAGMLPARAAALHLLL